MVKKLLTLFFAISQSALALGPLDNGHYNSTMSCTTTDNKTFSENVTLALTDNSMVWRSADSVDHKVFTIKKAGFFDFKSPRGHGSGYFTKLGMHFQGVIDGLDGEDTFFITKGGLALISSVFWEGGGAHCHAIFRR